MSLLGIESGFSVKASSALNPFGVSVSCSVSSQTLSSGVILCMYCLCVSLTSYPLLSKRPCPLCSLCLYECLCFVISVCLSVCFSLSPQSITVSFSGLCFRLSLSVEPCLSAWTLHAASQGPAELTTPDDLQKRASNPLQLELQMFLSCHGGTRNQAQVLCKNKCVVNH